MTPQGCYVPTYTSQENCFGVYHKMASSKEECLATTGCNTYNSIRVLSPLSTEECRACGHETFSYYRWTPGHWVSGTPVKLTWKKRQVIPLYDWDSTIDFELIQNIFLKSVQGSLFSDLKSQTLCDFNARKEVLQVIACACSEDGSPDCFSSSSKAIESGSGRPCIGLGSEIQNSVSSVTVSDSASKSPSHFSSPSSCSSCRFSHSVTVSEESAQRCVSITLSLISYLSMKQPEQLPFSPLTRIREYNSFEIVLNKDHAIVGRLMSDGVLLEMDGSLTSFQICLQVSEEADEPSSSSKFSHWDLGVPQADDEDFLTPLGLSPETKKLNNKTPATHCFEVLNPKQKESYFLIVRSKNFKKEDGSLYGKESIAWWVFAGIYSLLGFLSLAAVALHFLGYKIHLYFVGIFVSLAALCTIRAVYFYLVAFEGLKVLPFPILLPLPLPHHNNHTISYTFFCSFR
jgi:hypothetical protein